MLGEWCSRKTHLKHHFWVLDVSTTLCAKDCWSSSEAKVASGNSQSFPRRPNKIVPINVSVFDRSNWCVFTVIAKDILAVWEKRFLYQKEMSIFSLFGFERNEHNHMKVKLNTKIKKNRDQSKTHIARCSCNPLNLCSACIPMQVMHAIHVMLAHQVAHTIQISLVHTLSPIFINFHQFWLGLSVSSVFINFSYFIQLYRGGGQKKM